MKQEGLQSIEGGRAGGGGDGGRGGGAEGGGGGGGGGGKETNKERTTKVRSAFQHSKQLTLSIAAPPVESIEWHCKTSPAQSALRSYREREEST